MKKSAFIAGVLSLFAAAKTDAQEQPASKNPTVDSITSRFKLAEMPEPLTTEQVFPVIGQYQVRNTTEKTEVGTVRIMLDEQNKGIVWMEGLPHGKLQAQLRRSPATYKIPAQKTADGKDVPEGTLLYNKDTRLLKICLGKPYNMENPELAFVTEGQPAEIVKPKILKPLKATAKITKKDMVQKPVIYTGIKEEQTTVMINQ